MEVTMAARCIPIRELSRSTGELIDEVERDGKVFAVSRHGRMVALVMPLPERLVIEFENGTPLSTIDAEEVALDGLELSCLAREFLIDAASTPTGNWNAPETAYLADRKALFGALDELDLNGLTEEFSATGRRITKKGRAVARALRGRGDKGYGEPHPGIIAPTAKREGS